jgi:hypothetical protein
VDDRSGGEAPSGATRTAAWIVGGAAVATAGAGLALNLAARSKRTEFDDSCETRPDGVVVMRSIGTLSVGECGALLGTFEDYRRWSIVGYISGAALAVTSGVLFFTSRASSAGNGAPAAQLACAPTPTGLSCGGTF